MGTERRALIPFGPQGNVGVGRYGSAGHGRALGTRRTVAVTGAVGWGALAASSLADGGSLENRARVIFEIIDGVRARCRPDFQLGLRLSPERFGLKLAVCIISFGFVFPNVMND